MIERLRAQDPEGYAECCDALAQADLRSPIAGIRCPTLVVAGLHDPITTVADANALKGQVSCTTIAVLEASHLSNIEANEGFTDILRRFLLD